MDYGGGERYWYVCKCTSKKLVADLYAACTFGASVICVDLVIRQFPGHRNFKIEDSNTFLSTGLSLSFGVMVRITLHARISHLLMTRVDIFFFVQHAAIIKEVLG